MTQCTSIQCVDSSNILFCTSPSVKKIIASVDYDEEGKPSFSLSSYQNQLIYLVNSDLYIVIVLSTV